MSEYTAYITHEADYNDYKFMLELLFLLLYAK